MSLFKSITSRRREVRKNLPQKEQRVRSILSRGDTIWSLSIAVLFVAVASLIVIAARNEPAYLPTQIVDKAQVARVEFKSVDLLATQTAKKRAIERSPVVYQLNESFMSDTKRTLSNLPQSVANLKSVTEKAAADFASRFGQSDESLKAIQLFNRDDESKQNWKELISEFISQLRYTAILRTGEAKNEPDYKTRPVQLGTSANAREIEQSEVTKIDDPVQLNATIARLADKFSPAVIEALKHYFRKAAQPTYDYSSTLSQQARNQALAAVKDVEVQYWGGDILVPAGAELSPDGYRLLKEHLEAIPFNRRLITHGGLLLLVLLVSLVLVGYIVAVKPRVAHKPMRSLVMAVLLLGSLALPILSLSFMPSFGPASSLPPALLVALILSIAYDQRFALGIAVLHIMLLGLAFNLSASMVLVTIVVSALAISQLRELRHRTTLSRVGFVTGIAAAAGVIGAGLVEKNLAPGIAREIGQELLIQSGFSFVACLFVGLLVFGLLPFIERLFNVTTSMTLLELADMNNPLLKRLQQAAPGTFNHSLQVAALAGAAAEAIGANSLLTRVGAYYHDIGKIHKPQYFVENQLAGRNQHEKLQPAMSLLIIVGHVKDGIEMAREYGLPKPLHQFIETHHGTTLVEYFYHAAKKQKGDDEQPDEFEFRYPGPKPQTKEAACLMISDAVESACRTLSDPTPLRIEQLVHSLSTKRLMDDQFGECDITLAEIKGIEQAVTKSLTASYHGRVAYPDAQKENAKEDIQKEQSDRHVG